MAISQTSMVGNVVATPELRETKNGTKVATVRFAPKRTRQEFERDAEPVWVELEAWGGMADIVCENFVKGDQLYVEATLTGAFNDTPKFRLEAAHILQDSGTRNLRKTVNAANNDRYPKEIQKAAAKAVDLLREAFEMIEEWSAKNAKSEPDEEEEEEKPRSKSQKKSSAKHPF